MSETRRLLEAAASLSYLLHASGVPHAFYGNVLTAALSNAPHAHATGESGPRHLDKTTVMKLQGVPFLTISEFIRAKLKTWIIRGSDGDARDISYVLSRYWNGVDINRIPEQDMTVFVSRNSTAAPAWTAIKRKYGM
ncbi:hypothetical protein DXG03_005928 [Asterophora parasitica]|uniref:Uncharacterized protein n=1 Tax=Asterophora parasitica TaxID=117018 RepID=A0A9P7GE43_9AGAR|nr:hypothetical protein DXG03_005928 [Asterophora parasitica]